MHIYVYTVKPKFIMFNKTFHILENEKFNLLCITHHICLQSLLQNKNKYPPPPPAPPPIKTKL